MILEKGNMWSVYDQSDLFLITANSTLNSKGELVMGAGMAKEAKERFPDLPSLAGFQVRSLWFYGLLTFNKIGLFQTKTHWQKPSTLELILRSTAKLIEYLEMREEYYYRNLYKDKKEFEFRVDLNFPGIGKGSLKREDVLPIISVLPDNVHIWEY